MTIKTVFSLFASVCDFRLVVSPGESRVAFTTRGPGDADMPLAQSIADVCTVPEYRDPAGGVLSTAEHGASRTSEPVEPPASFNNVNVIR